MMGNELIFVLAFDIYPSVHIGEWRFDYDGGVFPGKEAYFIKGWVADGKRDFTCHIVAIGGLTQFLHAKGTIDRAALRLMPRCL